MRKFFLLSTFAMLFFSTPALANHATGSKHDVSIKVNGLVCDFCAQALEKLFREEKAVKDIHINLGLGYVDLDFNESGTLDDETIKKLIIDSGYDVKAIERDGKL